MMHWCPGEQCQDADHELPCLAFGKWQVLAGNLRYCASVVVIAAPGSKRSAVPPRIVYSSSDLSFVLSVPNRQQHIFRHPKDWQLLDWYTCLQNMMTDGYCLIHQSANIDTVLSKV